MGKIVVIGGGEIKDLGTLLFDKRIVELTRKKKPTALFIPTASGEPEGYIDTFNRIYGKKLGCNTDALTILKERPTKKQLRDKILGSDLIYVGGGNTLKMMKRWRLLGVDKLLREAHRKGIVLSGLSAGGICWFDSGHSDSMHIYGQKNWQYINVKGLGFIKGIHCPHFDSHTGGRSRRRDFMKFMSKYSQVGIGIDEKCAIEFVDDKYRVIVANRDSRAYRVFRLKGKVKIEEIERSKEFTPIRDLYKKTI